MNPPKITGFEIIEKIGTGGMATVWKARQISLDRIVAIKVLGAGIDPDPEAIQMFQSEAQAAAKLKHPSIIQVYDASVENGAYYFVMEYVAGYTIGDWLRRKGRLPEQDALLLADCVADALDHAWRREGIIHCDIKPDNVMIDSDGTVKVADLGLSRTINAMRADDEAEEVMGTPAYMSPEQAMGRADLDCRADIYSLGAMLFHLCTGRMLFHDRDEDAAMEGQVNAVDEDPMDVNPELSAPVCWFLEKLLAKDPAGRPADWGAVRVDIERVRNGKFPSLPLPKAGASTVARGQQRMDAAGVRPGRAAGASPGTGAQRKPAGRSPAVKGALVVAAAVTAIALAWTIAHNRQSAASRANGRVAGAGHEQGVNGGSAREPERVKDAEAAQRFAAAREWAREHPEQPAEAMRRYQHVMELAGGTEYATLAAAEVLKLNQAVQRQQQEDRLRRQEAEAERRLREAEARAAREAEAAARADGERCAEILDETAEAIVARGIPAAVEQLTARKQTLPPGPVSEQVEAVHEVLAAALAVEETILNSFKSCKGQPTEVLLKDGRKTLVIDEVRNGLVHGRQEMKRGNHVAGIAVSFGIKDLADREKVERIGSVQSPAGALVKGVIALEAGAFEHARRFFGETEPAISERLLAHLDAAVARADYQAAEQALRSLLQACGVSIQAFDAAEWLRAVQQATFAPAMAKRIEIGMEAFNRKYGKSEFADDAESVLNAIAEKARSDAQAAQPPPGPALAEAVEMVPVAEAAANAIVGDAVRMLMQSNPQLLATDLRFGFHEGVPVAIELYSPGIQDIRALAGIRTLRRVSIGAVPRHRARASLPHAPLTDISPLEGLPIDTLYLGMTKVKDLAALEGMPLQRLYLPYTSVDDLTPLRRMALQEVDLSSTPVKHVDELQGMPLRRLDLSETHIVNERFLRQMPLRTLNLSGTQIRDIAILSDMPLQELSIARTRVYNFRPLTGLPLTFLNVSDTQFKDTSVLAGMALRHLDLAKTGVTDIAALRGMPLKVLSLADTPIRDFGPIAGLPLRELQLDKCRFEDVSLLRGMPLEVLDLSETRVEDLSPMEGMRIRWLNINATDVRNLDPLKTLPLRVLHCRGLRNPDYGPLMRMRLHDVSVDGAETGAVRALLRSMPELSTVNGRKWKRW